MIGQNATCMVQFILAHNKVLKPVIWGSMSDIETFRDNKIQLARGIQIRCHSN